MYQFVLTIDIGTTSTKALAFLPDGTIVGSFQKGYPTSYPQSGYAEQSPDEILEAVIEAIATIKKVTEGFEIVACVFSSAMHSFMAVDSSGEPLTNLIIWADNRSEAEASELKSSSLGNRIYELGGTPIHPMAPLCKLLWLQKNQPGLFAEASKFISIKEYVLFKLTGIFAIDFSIASATGLLDTKQLTWNREALDLCRITSAQLSQSYNPEHAFAFLPTVANQLGIDTKVPVIIGASDGCLANLGSRSTDPGQLAITIGTSGAVRMTSNHFKVDPQQRTFCYYLSDEKFIVGGASNNGAVLLNWFSEQIQNHKQTAGEFLHEAFSVDNTEGLMFLPYVMGERAPIYSSDARGAYVGISINHTQVHFKRALIEGVCFAIKSIVSSVEEAVMPAAHVTVSGGFIKSEKWVQLLCHIINKPLSVDSAADASSIGAAMLGFSAIGLPHDFAKRPSKLFYPDKEQNSYLEKKYHVFQSLYESLKHDFTKIKKL